MRAIGNAVMLLLAACHNEPDFDERYDAASKEIQARAVSIDAELEQPNENNTVGTEFRATIEAGSSQPEN